LTQSVALQIKMRQLIVVGCFTEGGSQEKEIYEGYNCCLMRYDSEGNVLSEKSFTGGGAFPNKYPELLNIDTNRFWITYDQYSLPTQKGYRIVAFDSNLEQLWAKDVINKDVHIPMYAHTVPVTPGGFVVAYNEGATDLKVEQYSASGELIASLSLQNYYTINVFQLVADEKNVFLIALSQPTAFSVPTEKVTYRVTVKIAAIAME